MSEMGHDAARAAFELIDALAGAKGAETIAAAWENACLMFGRFGLPVPPHIADSGRLLFEIERLTTERNDALARAKYLETAGCDDRVALRVLLREQASASAALAALGNTEEGMLLGDRITDVAAHVSDTKHLPACGAIVTCPESGDQMPCGKPGAIPVWCGGGTLCLDCARGMHEDGDVLAPEETAAYLAIVGERAYVDIRAERQRQIAKGRTAEKDDERATADWDRCLDAVIWNKKNHGERALWIKIASVAVSAIQSFDRLAEGCEATPDSAWAERVTERERTATPGPVACHSCGAASRSGAVTAGTFVCGGCRAVWRLRPDGREALSTPWSAAAVEASAEMLAAERESTEPHPRAPGQVWRLKNEGFYSRRVLLVAEDDGWWAAQRCDEQGLPNAETTVVIYDRGLVDHYTFEREAFDFGAVEDDGL
jgi:hypothetical protein